MIEVYEIVRKWLKENNYDGLYSSDGECACELSDLQPCGENFSSCTAGIKKTWDELPEDQQVFCEPDCEFYITKKEIK